MNNPAVYANPEAFDPDRFLDEDGQLDPLVADPTEHVFGYGRRRCPGRHFVLTSIWQHIASILATFEIQPAVDEEGRAVQPSLEYTGGLVRCALGL